LASAGESAGEKVTVGQKTPSFTLAAEGASLDSNISFSIAHPGRGRKDAGGGTPASGPIPAGGGQPHWGRRIALGAAGLLAAAGIGFGVDRAMNSGDDNSESGVAPLVTPNTEPTKTPTVEATPTEVDPANATESPYKFGFSQKVGNVTVQITEKTQNRTECPDPASPTKSAKLVPCNPTHEIVTNRDVFPDAEERIKKEFEMGIYFAWQHAEKGREGISFEEYMQRANKGEDMSIKARGFQGSSFLPSDITISPKDKFFYDTIHEPTSIIRPWTSLGVGYRVIKNSEGEDEFHVEVFDFTAGGVGQEDTQVVNYGPGNLLAVGLSFLSFPDIQKSGTFITPAQNESLSPVVIPLRNQILTRVNGVPFAVLGAE
jgi:hypothetical protein